MNRNILYTLANAVFGLCVIVALPFAGPGIHPLFLLLLFALCSTPILSIRRLNDRYALLGIFSFMYFMWFGNLDFIRMFSGEPVPLASDGFMDAAEVLILLSGLSLQLAYRVMATASKAIASGPAKDYAESLLVVGGIIGWSLTTVLVWKFNVHVITDSSAESIARGLKTLSPLETLGFMLASYLQPCCIMVLAYTLCKHKRLYLIPVMLGVIGVQFIIGLVANGKGLALSGLIILMVTKVLVDGKISKVWLAATLAVIAVAFPVLQANRVVLGARQQNNASAAQDILQTFSRALGANDKVNSGEHRAQTIFERVSLKDTVEVIVTKTGDGVEFQGGHTLIPLLTTFIPRVIWPTKPSLEIGVGRMVAQSFFPDASTDVFISPSHLGELYWNFGGLGAVLSMAVIGALLGWVGARYELSESVTLTRVLILAMTIQILVQGFESSVANQYSTWLRLMLGIGVVHVLFARTPVAREPRDSTTKQATPLIAVTAPRFPNLMR
jgi:hypothetical protein